MDVKDLQFPSFPIASTRLDQVAKKSSRAIMKQSINPPPAPARSSEVVCESTHTSMLKSTARRKTSLSCFPHFDCSQHPPVHFHHPTQNPSRQRKESEVVPLSSHMRAYSMPSTSTGYHPPEHHQFPQIIHSSYLQHSPVHLHLPLPPIPISKSALTLHQSPPLHRKFSVANIREVSSCHRKPWPRTTQCIAFT